MPFIIAEPCVGTCDTACVDVCPVDCIHGSYDKEGAGAEVHKDGFNPDLVHDIYRRITINEYKRRQAAPGLRVSSKAFGLGRRIPIVNHFTGRRS